MTKLIDALDGMRKAFLNLVEFIHSLDRRLTDLEDRVTENGG